MIERRERVFLIMLVSVFMILISFTLGAKFLLVSEIKVIDEDKVYTVMTIKKKVSSIIDSIGISINESDIIEPSLGEVVDDSKTILIKRGYDVFVKVDGKTKKVITTKTNVREILIDEGITIEKTDRVAPSLDGNVNFNETIVITRVDTKEEKERIEIPFDVVIQKSEKLSPGEVKVLNEGVNGAKEVVYSVKYEDGYEVERNMISEVVVVEKVDQILQVGVEKLFVTDRGKPYRIKEVIVMRATAYDLSFESCGKLPDHPLYGITRSGTQARPGVVAVDQSVIKLGTQLYVESLDGLRDYGFSSAEDTGSAIKGNKIDLFIGDSSAARRYGVRYVRVYVLDEKIDESMIVGYGK